MNVALMKPDAVDSNNRQNASGNGPVGPGCSSNVMGKRLSRELKTVRAMMTLYCKGRHGGGTELCAKCRELMDYAEVRLQRCAFGENKPTCANCPVHCYQPKRQAEMQEVMRYAGPRMLWKHPVLCVRHWLDGSAAAPEKL